MKRIFFLISILLLCLNAFSQTTNPKSEKVHSYAKKNGEHVKTHYRTAPNKTTKDNYSHKGNTNPHTGKRGSKK